MKIKLLSVLPLVCLLFAGNYQTADAQIPNAGLELHLPCDGNAIDASGKNHNGILEGAKLTTDRLGNPNSAYEFDNGANIKVPEFSSAGFKGITISTWIKTSKTNPQQHVIQGIVGVLYVNWIKTGHFMAAFDGTAGNNKSGEVSTTYVADGKWHHVAATNDGSNTRVYVDGSLEATYSEPLLTGVRDIQIGGGGWFFTGSMDDIQIYNHALTTTEIKALKNGSTSSVKSTITEKSILNIYPNPASGNHQVTIEIPEKITAGNLSISNLTGQEIYTKPLAELTGNQTLPIDMKHFSAGIYMVKISSDKGIYSTKLILQ